MSMWQLAVAATVFTVFLSMSGSYSVFLAHPRRGQFDAATISNRKHAPRVPSLIATGGVRTTVPVNKGLVVEYQSFPI